MGKFWAKSVLCNHRMKSGEVSSEYVCVCVLSSLSCPLWSSSLQLCFLSSLLSVNRKQIRSSLSLFLLLSALFGLSLGTFLFLFLPCLPLWAHTVYLESVRPPAGCRVRRFIQAKCDILACPGRLDQLLLTYFLLALFWSFLFFFLGFSLESCQKWWATATVACDIVFVIFCSLSSSPYLARIWCSCVREVLQAPQGLPFPHRWRHEVFRQDRRLKRLLEGGGGGCAFGTGLAQHCLLLLSPKMSSLDSLCYSICYKRSRITHVETLAGNQTHTRTESDTSCS